MNQTNIQANIPTENQSKMHSKNEQKSTREWLSLRVSSDEKSTIIEQANFTGLSTSEYIRRKLFGGRPITAQMDEAVIRELRRIGGLLKHNFTILREAKVDAIQIQNMNNAYHELVQCINTISSPNR